MIEGKHAGDRPDDVAIDTAEVMLVATDTASTGGETLAASALTFWRLPIEPTAARMRALVAGAASATSTLRPLCVRLVLLPAGVLLEVIFMDADPHDYATELMPDDAEWSWWRDLGGRWHLRDLIDLRPPHTNE